MKEDNALSPREPLPTPEGALGTGGRIPEVLVGGDYMERSIAEHERACLTLIENEQFSSRPDTYLIATLCDSVRLGRELVRMARSRLGATSVQSPANPQEPNSGAQGGQS